MNSRQNAKLNMAQRVSDTLHLFGSAFEKVPVMTDAVKLLDADIAAIREVVKEQGAVNVPASTLAKREAEQKMIEPCVKIANVLYVFGFSTGNKELTTLNGLSENSFYSLNNNGAIALAGRILDLAKANAASLSMFGVGEEDLEAATAAIEAYRAVVAKPMVTIGEHKQKTSNLAQLFARLDSTLCDKLDKLMILFKQPVPDLYEAYRTARNLIYNWKGQKDAAEKPPLPSPDSPAAN